MKIFDVPDELKFKAAVAFYPMCDFASQQLTIPTIILIGELDDRSSDKLCEQWMAVRKGKGALVQLVVYPSAYHAFDVPGLRDGKLMFGHWLKFDPDAAEKSMVEMHGFLSPQLSK